MLSYSSTIFQFRVGVSDDDISESESDDEKNMQPATVSDENSQSQSSETLPDKETGESQSSSETPLNEKVSQEITSSEASSEAPAEHTEVIKEQAIEKSEPVETTKTEEEKPVHTEEPTVFEPIVLEDFQSPQQLETLGLNQLKFELQSRGMKCGGTLAERASRLYCVKGSSPDKIDPSLLAKPAKKK